MNDQNWLYVGAAYVLTWGAILGYVIRVHRALGQARAEFARASQNTEGTQ